MSPRCLVTPCADLPRIPEALVEGPVYVEDRNGEHYVPPGEAVLYTPAAKADDGAIVDPIISWRAWRDDLGEVGDMEADGAVADAIAVRLGILRGGPLACRLAVYRGGCALCETEAPAGVLEAA